MGSLLVRLLAQLARHGPAIADYGHAALKGAMWGIPAGSFVADMAGPQQPWDDRQQRNLEEAMRRLEEHQKRQKEGWVTKPGESDMGGYYHYKPGPRQPNDMGFDLWTRGPN